MIFFNEKFCEFCSKGAGVTDALDLLNFLHEATFNYNQSILLSFLEKSPSCIVREFSLSALCIIFLELTMKLLLCTPQSSYNEEENSPRVNLFLSYLLLLEKKLLDVVEKINFFSFLLHRFKLQFKTKKNNFCTFKQNAAVNNFEFVMREGLRLSFSSICCYFINLRSNRI